MMNRTLSGVLVELEDERHVPLAALVQRLAREGWAEELGYDLSMLRLWIARPGSEQVEVMIVYGDGRGGGRPTAPYVDAFETSTFVGSAPADVASADAEGTLARLRAWFGPKGNQR